ncbi:MAG: glycerate kinase [Alphaproteobacteria bacterium]|nr:glycerate kinase [Alphaproteobacteria bacterium]
MTAPRDLLRAMFEAAVARADPALCLPPHVPKDPPQGRTIVIGAGKAAAAMAAAIEAQYPHPLAGLVVTRYGHGMPTKRIEVVEAAHPVPDAAGAAAARRILDLVQDLRAEDRVICLLSGGGSALLALPAPGLTLDDKRALNRALLAAGADIREINTARKHLSAIKGGRLALAAHPAETVTLAISDVPGDDPATIASGPTVADPTSFAVARAVLAKYKIAPPAAIARHLAEAKEETPKPGDPRLARARYTLIATPAASLEAAAEVARKAGYETLILGDALEGDAAALGRDHARLALARQRQGKKLAILSGGETTVAVRVPGGSGGRNREYLLGLVLGLEGAPGIHALAADTDGIDGSEDAAGAIAGPDTIARSRAIGLDPAERLAANDAGGLFRALGDAVITGPTRTNVNDFRGILVGPPTIAAGE